MLRLFRKPWNSPPNGDSPIQYLPYEKHLKSRIQSLSFLGELVATDTVFSDTPTVDIGVKQGQVFVGQRQISHWGHWTKEAPHHQMGG